MPNPEPQAGVLEAGLGFLQSHLEIGLVRTVVVVVLMMMMIVTMHT